MGYEGIAVDALLPFIFLSLWLTWGCNEEGKEFVSRNGNFGNAMRCRNVRKSIVMKLPVAARYDPDQQGFV